MTVPVATESKWNELDPWYLHNLVDPVDQSSLSLQSGRLRSAGGRTYPVVDGIPIMLVPSERQTIGVARATLDRATRASEAVDNRNPSLYLETLGINESEKKRLLELVDAGHNVVDPVVSVLIGATSGHAYTHLIGSSRLGRYPIPDIGLPCGTGKRLLDLGCSWGRWCVAAAQAGYDVVGLDPSLGAVAAARRVATDLSVDVKYVVGDARCLPFRTSTFDVVHSYSVLQHFPKADAGRAFSEAARVLTQGGLAAVQLAHAVGLRSFYHQLRRKFREPVDFEVRYWSMAEMREVLSGKFSSSRIISDGFFGLGLRWEDRSYMPATKRGVLLASEVLKRASRLITPLCSISDSLLVLAVK